MLISHHFLVLILLVMPVQFVIAQNMQSMMPSFNTTFFSCSPNDRAMVAGCHEPADYGYMHQLFSSVHHHTVVNTSKNFLHPLKNRITPTTYPTPFLFHSEPITKKWVQPLNYQHVMLAAVTVYVGYEALLISYAWWSANMNHMPPLLGRVLQSHFNYVGDLPSHTIDTDDLGLLLLDPIFEISQLPYSQLLVDALNMANYELRIGGVLSEATEIELFDSIVQEEHNWLQDPFEVECLLDCVGARYSSNSLVDVVDQIVNQVLIFQQQLLNVILAPDPDLQDEN